MILFVSANHPTNLKSVDTENKRSAINWMRCFYEQAVSLANLNCRSCFLKKRKKEPKG